MKNFLLLLLLSTSLLRLLSEFDKKPDVDSCRKYRLGTFTYHFKSNDKTFYFTITRKDSTQIERNEQNGNTSKFKIIWLDNCSYELYFLEGTEVLSKELLAMKKNMIVRTTILASG